jgi:acetolactate synthase-1/2/3 large subunit
MSKPQTGAEQIINQLVDNGVVHVFGYSGGAALPLFDALSLHNDIEIIVPRHEQGATHMADGYARVSGKVGVGVVTSGPGVTITSLLKELHGLM